VSLLKGIDGSTVVCLMQRVLNFINRWCNEVDLPLHPNKIEVVWFIKSTKRIMHHLKLKKKRIIHSPTVKCLGVTLDSRLMWTTHCRAKVAKARIALMQCKRAVGKTWGLNPFLIQWIYKAHILLLIYLV